MYYACRCAGDTGLGNETVKVGLSNADGDFALIGLVGLVGSSMDGERELTGWELKGSSSCSTTKPKPVLLGETGMCTRVMSS